MLYTYEEKLKLAKVAVKGDQWRNIKTGRIATVLGRAGVAGVDLKLKHESGRETTKQEHYFAGDFEPVNSATGS